MRNERKLRFCPSCGSEDTQVEGARDEGRYFHCFTCGAGGYANRLRPVKPVRAKPPCENLERDINSDSSHATFHCILSWGKCVHQKDNTVSCSTLARKAGCCDEVSK